MPGFELTDRPVLSRSVTVALLCCLGCTSCAEDEPTLALNVTLKDTARPATSLEVTISQAGHTSAAATISVPTKPTDAGPVFKEAFFERVALPSDYSEGQAAVNVVAKQGAVTLASALTTIAVDPEGVVAGYVTLGEAKPTAPADAGTDDAGE